MKLKKAYQGNICFLDAEYNMPPDKDMFTTELLSVGAIICDEGGEILYSYYRIVRTEHPLSGKITELTKLEDQEVETQGISYLTVMKRLMELYEKFDIHTTLVWGTDRKFLEQDLTDNRPYISKTKKRKIRHHIFETIINADKSISSETGMFQVSLESMKWLCGVPGKVEHHALSDAMDLYNVMQALWNREIPEERMQLLRKWYEERSRYSSMRRFKKNSKHFLKSLPEEQRNTLQKMSRDYAAYLSTLLGGYDNTVLLALRDDMFSLSNDEQKGFPSLPEYEKYQVKVRMPYSEEEVIEEVKAIFQLSGMELTEEDEKQLRAYRSGEITRNEGKESFDQTEEIRC